MVLRYLTVWGCPPDLLARMSPPKAAPSRPLLLALAWLVAQCCLFQRALARTQLPLELLQLLPPYSQVYDVVVHVLGYHSTFEATPLRKFFTDVWMH